MKRLMLAVMLLALCCGPCLLQAAETKDYTGTEWYPGHLLVNFKEPVGALYDKDGHGGAVTMGVSALDDLLAKYQVTRMERVVDDGTLYKLKSVPDLFRLMLLTCPEQTDILRMAEEFASNPLVESADPDILHHTYDHTPNDALWNAQWDKRLIHCPRAWEFTTGIRDMIMCAVDGGTYWRHPDFRDNLWVNPEEDVNQNGLVYADTSYPGDPEDVNGTDEDSDGKPDDLIGWDFLRNVSGCEPGEDCDSQEDNDPTGFGDHGTHVAGLMGAVGDNGIGVAGVNYGGRVMACRAGYQRASDHQGLIMQSAAINCMLWAVANGASIINMSYGSSSSSSPENNAIQACWNNGAVLVGAAGNDHVSSIHYPAGYNHVVSVGSVDNNDGVSYFSNYGTWVDCFSPGNDVMSLYIQGYGLMPGTSMASPNAAGVIGLIWSRFPGLSNQEVVDLVLNNCQDITAQNPSYQPDQLGRGRVDPMLVMQTAYAYLSVSRFSVTGDNDADGRLEPGESGSLVMTFLNEAGWATAQNVQVAVSTTDPNLTLQNATFPLGTVAPGDSVQNTGSPVQVTVSSNVTQSYYATVRAVFTGDNDFSLTRDFQLRIGRPQILVVADDGQDQYHTFYTNGLMDSTGGYDYDVWSTAQSSEPTYADVHEYPIIVWVCGNESANTITASNQAMLSQFLDGGGRLLAAGQSIDEDISGTTFYGNYLHAETATGTTNRSLSGVTYDPISDGLTLLLQGGGCGGNGTVSPSVITPVNGGAAFFTYSSGAVGAVRFENSTYKTAYFAFALEAACGAASTAHHRVVIRRTMAWFGATPSAVEPTPAVAVPAGFALHTNYPNPFNPTTTLTFDLAKSARVSLKVYDITGRMVRELVNAQMPAGTHSVMFDGAGLASGTYLARMEAAGQTATQKMLLLK